MIVLNPEKPTGICGAEVAMNRSPTIPSQDAHCRHATSPVVEDEGLRQYEALLEERAKRGELDPGTVRAYLSDVRAFAQGLNVEAGAPDTLRATPQAVGAYLGRVVASRS